MSDLYTEALRRIWDAHYTEDLELEDIVLSDDDLLFVRMTLQRPHGLADRF